MKKHFSIVFIFSLILMLSSCGNSSGEVVRESDRDIFFGSSEAYDIGENKYGEIIFKDTDKAFEQVIIDYADGFKAIEEQFNFKPVSKENWEKYKTYGAHLETDDEKIIKQGATISQFFSFYENSFK